MEHHVEHLPLLDLTPFYTRSADELEALSHKVGACLVTDGFLLIVGHRVPDTTRNGARAGAKRFFRQPDHFKERFRVVDRRGWVPSGHEATGYASGEESLPDLKESFTVGHEPDSGDVARYRPNRWSAHILRT